MDSQIIRPFVSSLQPFDFNNIFRKSLSFGAIQLFWCFVFVVYLKNYQQNSRYFYTWV